MVSHIRPAKGDTGCAPPPGSCVDAGKRGESSGPQVAGEGLRCPCTLSVCRLSVR